jgi:hypothetical protein
MWAEALVIMGVAMVVIRARSVLQGRDVEVCQCLDKRG